MRKRLLLAGFLLSACAPLNPPAFVLVDEPKSLNAAALEAAAAPLLQHGDTVLVYLVNKGDLDGRDLARRLNESGRLSRDHIRSHTVAVYACLKPRYSELRIGEPWSSRVTGHDLEEIRSQVLNPGLRSNSPQQAYLDSLARLGEKVNAEAEHQAAVRHILFIVVSVGLGLLLFWWAAVQYPRAAPFRLLGWIWRQTPPGKAEVRRQEQARLKSSQTYVRNWEWVIDRDRALIGWIPSELQERLQRFDLQRKRVEQMNLAEASELAGETERLFQLVSELSRPWSDCRTSYEYAAEVLKGLRKAPTEPWPELADFHSRLEQCKQDARREGLTTEELERVTARQRQLREQMSAFWKQKEPASWKARFESGSTSSTDSSVSSYEPSTSSSSSSSSYDYNQDQNWSSGSSESRSGGEW